MVISKYANNNGTKIHYYDSYEMSDNQLLPIVICPGLSETAEEYMDLLEAVRPRRCILLSFRGRGKSDTPAGGYDLEEHISDLASVVHCTGVKLFHLLGYSRGVAYALGYAQRNKEQVKSLILGDYPPEHRAMPLDWPEDYISNYLIPYNRTDYIRPEAVWGIQKESSQISLESSLAIQVLVARGKLEESLVSDHDLRRYKKMCIELIIKEYAHSGHDIKEMEKALFYSDIVQFMEKVDSACQD